MLSVISFDFHRGLGIATSDNSSLCKLFRVFTVILGGGITQLEAVRRDLQPCLLTQIGIAKAYQSAYQGLRGHLEGV
jgi:hypothetical protein